MTKQQIELVLGRVATWPRSAQEELLRSVGEIEQRQVGTYRLSAAELAAIEEGLAQADRGEFVTDQEMEAFFSGQS